MPDTPAAADARLATGILSVEQAAEMLGVAPTAVKRLIALNAGHLPDNRNAKGSVVMQSDLEAYIGRGSRDLTMPAIDGGWFITSSGHVSRSAYLSAMKRFADAVPEVSDRQVQEAYSRDESARVLTFNVKPPAAMIAAFRADYNARLGAPPAQAGFSFGVASLMSRLRDNAKFIVDRNKGLGPAIWKLYETPEQFRQFVDRSRSTIEADMRITFRDARNVEGRYSIVTVDRQVEIRDLSADLEADIRRAIELAF